jgi:hypothetical protein
LTESKFGIAKKISYKTSTNKSNYSLFNKNLGNGQNRFYLENGMGIFVGPSRLGQMKKMQMCQQKSLSKCQ